MATFHFTLRKPKARKTGEIPIYLRITANRKYCYLSTGIQIVESRWNPDKERVRKSSQSHKAYNSKLESLLVKAREAALTLQNELNDEPSAKAIKRVMQGESQGKFFPYAFEYRDELDKRDKYWQYRQVKPVIDKFRAFTGEYLTFKDITPALLRRFESYLAIEHDNNQNTIYKNLSVLRRIIRQAVNERIIGVQDNPFHQYEMTKGKAKKEKLSIEEIQKIENTELEQDSRLWHTRNYFLFSFYCAGIRFTDMCTLQWKHIQDNRLKYRMSKTDQPKNIKLLPQAKAILQHYEHRDTGPEARIFPILPDNQIYKTDTALQKAIDSRNTTINNHLKNIARKADIETNITFHIARHSFADYARQKGMSLYDLSKALGHSSLSITEAYLKSFDEESLDSAMDDLF